MTVRTVKRTIKEGQAAQWRIALARGVDYDLFIDGKIVRGPRPAVSARRRQHRRGSSSTSGRKSTSTSRCGPTARASSRHWTRANKSVVLTVPIQRDGVAEGRETITLKIRENGKVFTRTIVVKPSK